MAVISLKAETLQPGGTGSFAGLAAQGSSWNADGDACGRARAALADWLHSSAVAREDANGRVGIVNWLDPDSDAHDGFYPEIGGYYLSFLAQSAEERDNTACGSVASGVLQWFEKVRSTNALCTIERAVPRAADWRNKCVFTFDLAMIVRGMLAAERRWPGIVQPSLLAIYLEMVEEMADGGRLGSHRLRAEEQYAFVPVKWSTNRDVHHIKAAAALMDSHHPATATAARTLDDWRQMSPAPIRELHPALYAVEGWLMEWSRAGCGEDLVRAAAIFAGVLDTIDEETHDFPAIAGGPLSTSRGDVPAQVLRAGSILARAGALDDAAASRWKALAPSVTANLLARLSPLGGVTFDRHGAHRNSWASMFAWQALTVADPERRVPAQDDAGAII